MFMRKLLPFVLILFALPSFAQTNEKAVAAYSVNDKLIGLSNLVDGLSDCPVRSVVGKVKRFKLQGDTINIQIKVDKKTRVDAMIPISRVSKEDRDYIFRHLITKRNTIRLSGYSCETDAPFSAFSVDRVY